MSHIKGEVSDKNQEPPRQDHPLNHLLYMPYQHSLGQVQSLPPWRKPSRSTHQYQAGKWTNKQQRKYIDFIEKHLDELKDKQNRKASKIFKKMSEAVQTRNADQCRSHHQKLSQYYASTEDIIRQYKAVFEQRTGTSIIPPTSKSDTDPRIIDGQFYTIETFGNKMKIVIKADQIRQYEP